VATWSAEWWDDGNRVLGVEGEGTWSVLSNGTFNTLFLMEVHTWSIGRIGEFPGSSEEQWQKMVAEMHWRTRKENHRGFQAVSRRSHAQFRTISQDLAMLEIHQRKTTAETPSRPENAQPKLENDDQEFWLMFPEKAQLSPLFLYGIHIWNFWWNIHPEPHPRLFSSTEIFTYSLLTTDKLAGKLKAE
jgi:hypothetical protein